MEEKPPVYDPGPNAQSYQQGAGYQPLPPQGYPPQPGGYPPPPAGAYPPLQPGGYPPAPDGGYKQQPGGYPPPPDGGYPDGYPPPQPAPVVVQPVVVGALQFGEHPMTITCPSCYQTVITSTEYECGTLTWLIVGVLCIVGCWLCCWIPCVAEGCKDVTHTCPNCKKLVGNYRRL